MIFGADADIPDISEMIEPGLAEMAMIQAQCPQSLISVVGSAVFFYWVPDIQCAVQTGCS
jgi:hypothetical protein